MPLCTIIVDVELNIEYIDEGFERLFGYSHEEVFGQKLTDYISDFTLQCSVINKDNHCVRLVALQAHSKTGDVFGVEYDIHTLSNPKNTSKYVVQFSELDTTSSDIRYQQHLNEIEGHQWLSYLLRSSPVVVYSCIPSGGFPTTFISENITKLTGYTTEHYLSDPSFWLNHLHPDDKDTLLNKMAVLFEEEKSHSFEYRFLCSNGDYIWVLDKLKIDRNKDGQPTEMVGLWLDITERKKDEQQLKEAHDLLKSRSEALEESNTELSQFTYVVSHDLKAPLRAIHSYCDWLSDDLLDSLDGDQKEYIEGMQDAVQQAENLIDDLLELSRVGRRAMAAEPIHLTPFFKDLTQSLITDTNVIIEITENLPIINVSNTLLTQVFQNLIVNAHTYNLSEQKEIKILGEVKGDNYQVSVSDNGMGIEERFHEQVFQLFQRLHTKEEIDGTGIGLAIVNKAVSCLNWSITLSSTLGEGSTFSVLIPLSEVKQ